MDISKYLGGNILKNIVGWLFIAYFICTSGIILRNFCQGLVVVYYPLTKYIFLILMFIMAISLVTRFKFNVTVKTASLIFPIVFLSIILLFLGNLGNFSFNRIYPILGDGAYNTFILGLKNIGAFGGICYMYFLPPMLKEPQKFKKIAVLSVIFTGLFTLFCVATLLFMFSYFQNTDEIIPLFSAARHIEFGVFFQRFESIFLLIWIISFCCYLTITCKFATHIFKKMFNLSDISLISMIFVLLLLGVSLIPKNYAISNFLETHAYRYLRIAIGFILGITVLIFANLKKKFSKTNERNSTKNE